MDSFGANHPMRALVAGPSLGGNGEREAMYPVRYTDAEGQTLNGAHRYELKMSEEPPVDAFWSLTMYNAADKLLVENPIQRYKVGTDTENLKKAADGLPASTGDFYLILRMYQPSDAILDGTYQLPQVTRTN